MLGRTTFLFVVALTILTVAVAPFAFGQEEEAAAGGQSLFTVIVTGGGFFGALIGLMSVAMVALVIEHFISVNQNKLMPPDLLNELEVLFEDQEYQEAMELCEAEPSFLTNVIGAALPKVSLGYDAMEKAIADVGDEEAIKLHQKIGWLSLIGNLAPMMGLLGTVYGMILAFQVIAVSAGPPEPKALAGKLQIAMVTTLLGLLVAIPAMSFFFFFRNKVVRTSLEVTGIAGELIDRFRAEG